ncbi:glycosyltransferase family 2 protein, partial [bacterium]|nr:glycosyltransferase family 2 protein [bacterium]
MAKKATVIILNYNGAKVITAAIDSVLASQTKYPFELIVVDNASTDTSPKLLRRLAKKHHFKTIFSPDNLGFAGGNNLGIKQSESEYVVLLNNDCVVDKHWLDELIACADRHPQAFSVASKICLYPHYFPVTWGIDPQVKVEQIQVVTSALNRFQPTGHQVSVPFMQDNVEAKLHFELPFDSQEDQQLMLAVTVGVPVDNQGNPLIAAWESIFSPENKKSVQQPQLISQQPGRGGRLQLTYQVTVNISQAAKKSAYRLLQNAGTLVFPNGYGRDIGASVYDSKQ